MCSTGTLFTGIVNYFPTHTRARTQTSAQQPHYSSGDAIAPDLKGHAHIPTTATPTVQLSSRGAEFACTTLTQTLYYTLNGIYEYQHLTLVYTRYCTTMVVQKLVFT